MPSLVRGLQLARASMDVAIDEFNEFTNNLRDYGTYDAFSLLINQRQAGSVIKRVRKHVVNGSEEASGDNERREPDGEAWSLKKSYAASFNMIAVAGAIIAQIAITALSLPYLEQTHWTAEAAFVISLISGLLSVYSACMVQLKLGALQRPQDVKQWLTTYRAARLGSNSRQIPSQSSAFLLAAPMELLNWSLGSLLVGIGIYYGVVYSKKLGQLRGENSNLAVLVIYIIFTYGALSTMLWPSLWNVLERNVKLKKREGREENQDGQTGHSTHGAGQQNGHPSGVVSVSFLNQRLSTSASGQPPQATGLESSPEKLLIDALTSSIAAQTASLRAQETLLESYRGA